MIKVNKSSNQSFQVFELRTPGISSPQEALLRWQQQNFPEQSADEFTILATDKLEVFRHPSQDPLLPNTKYLVIFRSLWQEVVKFMSHTKLDRHSGKSRIYMEELLLNNKLQFYARDHNEQGDSRIFDLFISFLSIASRPGISPFGRKNREKEGRFQMVKIGLHIIAIFISEAPSSDLREVRDRVYEMRQVPIHFHSKRGFFCMIGGLLILLIEGTIIGFIQIFL